MKDINIVCAVKKSRFETFISTVLPSILNFYNKFNDSFKSLNFIPNGFDDDEYLKILNYIPENIKNEVDIINGDSKYKVLNKYIPYTNKYGTNNYTFHIDDDIVYNENVILEFLLTHKKFPKLPIFAYADYMYYYSLARGTFIIGNEYVPVPSTMLAHCVHPNCGMWICPPNLLDGSECLNPNTDMKNDEHILFIELLKKDIRKVIINNTLNAHDTRLKYGLSLEDKNSESATGNIYLEIFKKRYLYDKEIIRLIAEKNEYTFLVNDKNAWSMWMLKEQMPKFYRTNKISYIYDNISNIMKYQFEYNWFTNL